MAVSTKSAPAKKARPNFTYAIVSVAMVLFLLGFFAIALLQTTRFVDELKERVAVLIEIKPDTNPNLVQQLVATLNRATYTKPGSVAFITKEQALQSLQDEFGEEFLEMNLPNPLYDVVTFHLQAKDMNEPMLQSIKTNFSKFNYINDVYYQEGLVKLVAERFQRIGWYALLGSFLFLLVAISLIHNTTRLALYANRFIIKNMELVGASWNFISRPFIIKSMWHGLWSAMLAIAVLSLLIWGIYSNMDLSGLIDQPASLIFIFIGLLFLGIFINAMSTWYVVNKYLKMRIDDLY